MRVIRHYTVRSGACRQARATQTQLLRFLEELDRKHYRKVGGKAGKSDLDDARCLKYYAKRAGLGRSAYEASGTMWNSEYVIALILTSNDLADAIPDGWLEPRGKRNKLPVQAPVPAAPAVPETREAPLQEQTRGMLTGILAACSRQCAARKLPSLCHACSSRESTPVYQAISTRASRHWQVRHSWLMSFNLLIGKADVLPCCLQDEQRTEAHDHSLEKASSCS